ncbi:SGNH/GDSL hydrolase family protein [Janthinobacterium sp. NKUCC08_JDC]|uniref:SGNH/GDSL hydrolase family protein n=1 Tax=Janthinobacterium sp. NKUCC08_JDC TaxID=2842122 RepID=UPI001C5BA9EE|nr:SGNH/GDSL hydrolase family protein [Janthinobacterium sp. NKUCC08_JDC]MBW3497750.1 SGNH/GDSL hydrolase family protein [Janthinobacterium sp. NKUCC08_JDC]
MRIKRLFLLLAFLLFVAIIVMIFRGEFSTCEVVAKKPLTNQTKVLIQYFGDSTVFGANPRKLNCQVSTSAPGAMAEKFEKKYGQTVLVWNEGIGGTKADYYLSGEHGSWQEIMRKSAAKIVIVNWGMNDAWFDPGVSVETYKGQLTALADAAKSNGKTIIFETPNPISVDKKPFGDQAKADRLEVLVDAMRQVAAEKKSPLIDQYKYVKSISDWKDLIPDGVHPKPELYRLKGEYSAMTIASIVEAHLANKSTLALRIEH